MPEAEPLRIVYMGTPRFAVPCLEALLAAQHRLAAVYVQPDRPAGRGREPALSPVKQLALQRGIEVVQPAGLRDPAAVERLAGFRPEVIVVVAYGLLLPRAVLEMPKYGALNVHPSLLPRYRGPSPIPWAILGGDRTTGVSIMLMDAGMDTGPVLEQREVNIADEDDAVTLSDTLAAVAADMLPGVLARWANGEIGPAAQDNARASYSRLISKQDGEIDWRLPAVGIWRRTRAFRPWPGCYTVWQGKTVKIIAAVPLAAPAAAAAAVAGEPGQVIELKAESPRQPAVGVVTGDGVLGLLRLQLEGKKETDSAGFVRGQKGFTGSVLPCG